jgi:hypothetical protein
MIAIADAFSDALGIHVHLAYTSPRNPKTYIPENSYGHLPSRRFCQSLYLH